MYKDIINYQLTEVTRKKDLLRIAQQIVNDWMRHQPGFIKWEIHANQENTFTDIVYWRSKEDAKNAEKNMDNCPNANEWYNCYKKESISSKKLTQIAEFSARK